MWSKSTQLLWNTQSKPETEGLCHCHSVKVEWNCLQQITGNFSLGSTYVYKGLKSPYVNINGHHNLEIGDLGYEFLLGGQHYCKRSNQKRMRITCTGSALGSVKVLCPSSALFLQNFSLLRTFSRYNLPKHTLFVSEWAIKTEKRAPE